MLLFCITRNKIILAEAIELPGIVLLLAALHLATLASVVVAKCCGVRVPVLASGGARIRIAIVRVYFRVGGTFTVHELRLIHPNMVLQKPHRESDKPRSKKSIAMHFLNILAEMDTYDVKWL